MTHNSPSAQIIRAVVERERKKGAPGWCPREGWTDRCTCDDRKDNET